MVSIYKFFSLLFFGLITIHSAAQRDTLATTSYDELRELIIDELKKKDTLRALTIIDYHRKRAQDEENHEEEAFGYGRHGYIVGINGKLDEGVRYLNEAIKIAKDNDVQELLLRAYISKGYVYNDNGLYPQSIEAYLNSLRMADDMQDYDTYYSLVGRIGWIKSSLEDHRGGIKIMKDGLKRLSSLEAPLTGKLTSKNKLKTTLLINIANAQNLDKQADSTLYYSKKVRELLILPEDSCYVKVLANVEAEAFLLKNMYEEAEDHIKIAMSSCRPHKAIDTLRWNASLAKAYLGRNQYQKSINSSLAGLRAYPVTADEEKFMIDFYKTMAIAYKSLGKIDSANIYLEKHLNTTLKSNKLSSELTNSFNEQEVKSFKREIGTLSKEKTKKEKLLLYGSIAGGCVIVVLIVVLINSIQSRKENEQKFITLLEKVSAAKAPKDIIDTKDIVLEEQSTLDMHPETTQQILDGLRKLEEQNYYLHPACSAPNVAKRIKTNTTYLSKVVNAEFGKNFSTYINDLRINHAIVRLKQDSKFRSYTISSIAKELGYKSADSFTKYFKKDTGLLPSFYIKKLNEATS